MDDILKDIATDWYGGSGGVAKETEEMYKFLCNYKPALQAEVLRARIEELKLHAGDNPKDSAFFSIILPNDKLRARLAELEAQATKLDDKQDGK